MIKPPQQFTFPPLALHPSHGVVKNKIQFHGRHVNLNIDRYQIVVVKPYGFIEYYMNTRTRHECPHNNHV
jgi:hypothetical protein